MLKGWCTWFINWIYNLYFYGLNTMKLSVLLTKVYFLPKVDCKLQKISIRYQKGVLWSQKRCPMIPKRCLTIPKRIPDFYQACVLGSFLRSQKTCLTLSFTEEYRSAARLSGIFLGIVRHFFLESSGIFFVTIGNFLGILHLFLGYK